MSQEKESIENKGYGKNKSSEEGIRTGKTTLERKPQKETTREEGMLVERKQQEIKLDMGKRSYEKPVKAERPSRDPKGEKRSRGSGFRRIGNVGKWFQILCFMNIPFFGVLYMFVKMLRRKSPSEERAFAAAFLLYRFLVLILAIVILYILYQIGLDFVGTLLKYTERVTN